MDPPDRDRQRERPEAAAPPPPPPPSADAPPGAALELFPRIYALFERFAVWLWAKTRGARRPDVALAAVKLLLPLLVLAAGAVVTAAVFPEGWAVVVFGVGYFFVPFGSPVSVPVALESGLPWWSLLAFVAGASACGSALLAFNFDHLLRLPRFGPWLRRAEERTAAVVARRKWLGRLEFWGVALFVALPVGGANAPAGVAVGRLLGMNAFFTFLAVWAGSVLQVAALVGVALGVLEFVP